MYEQWLHADLRDVTVNQSCIPHCVAQQQNCQINGRFIVQVSIAGIQNSGIETKPSSLSNGPERISTGIMLCREM